MDSTARTNEEAHDDREEREEEVWWEDGPVFSTSHHGSRIMALAPDAAVPHVDGIHIALLAIGPLLAGLCLAIVLPASIPPLLSVFGWSAWHLIWWVPLALGAAVVLVTLIPGTYAAVEDDFRHPSTALRAATFVTSAGLGIALLVWSWFLGLSQDEFMGALAPAARWGSAGSAVVAVCFGLLTMLGVREARRTARRIVRVRAHGRRLIGRIAEIPDPKSWILGRPQFRVTVRFSDGAEERTLPVSMSTRAHRVPIRGSSVLVLIAPDGTSYVELHPEHPIRFSRRTREYRAPSGGGGS